MTARPHGMTRFEKLIAECLAGRAMGGTPLPQVLGSLLPQNPITGSLGDETILGALDALTDSMKTTAPVPGPADAGMTFFGQFVDHDVTFDATSSIGTVIDPGHIRNVRTPGLDLDCVYGDGPEATPHLYHPDHHGFLLYGRDESHNDLARNAHGTALIGDPRNDENILVSQVQGAFICLHNILMTKMEEGGDAATDVHACAQMGIRKSVWDELPAHLTSFEEVRRFVRLHYQWVVLNDMLPQFVEKEWLAKILAHPPFGPDAAIMPVEFAGAAYRFGHATVQPDYVLKAGGSPVGLFDTRGFGRRGPETDIEMGRFFSIGGAAAQKAQAVGTGMADDLFELPFVGEGFTVGTAAVSVAQAKKLGLRNMLRDRYALLLPSGQQMARWLDAHAPHLGVRELRAPQVLRDHHITKTPLWFYCLQEAAEEGNGKLTGVGAAIVGSVFANLLRHDAESVVHLHGFEPWSGFGDGSLAGIMDFVEKNRDGIAHAEALRAG